MIVLVMKGGGGLLIIATIFAVLGRIVASSCSGANAMYLYVVVAV